MAVEFPPIRFPRSLSLSLLQKAQEQDWDWPWFTALLLSIEAPYPCPVITVVPHSALPFRLKSRHNHRQKRVKMMASNSPESGELFMRLGRFRLLFLTSVAISIAACAHAQSLGDIARKEQAKKGAPKSSKVITNDDLDSLRRGPDQITTASGNTAKPSDPTASASKEENQADTAKSDSAESKGDATAGDSQSASGGDKDSVQAGWKAKISDQKSKIELLEREI